TQIPDRTEWHNIKAWRGLSELAEKYIRKGSQLYIEGKIQTRSWEKDGIKRYATDIVADNIQLLGKRPDGVEPLAPTAAPQQPYNAAPSYAAAPSVPTYSAPVAPPVSETEEKDDLPF
ncbi:MAG: single-stranded DNA-binding protein, partial [Paludibacter sp.]|nr:single-stranded DNA-binding protein [Paludibacter sp.]